MHVAFSPMTGGGSVYYTDNEVVQRALEAHPKYGRLYKGSEVVAKKKADPAPAATKSSTKTIKVSCWEDAKDYLSETFGVSRTKLRTPKAIKETAASKGITFDGVE